MRFTQWLQLTIQKRIISRVLGMGSERRPKPPLFFKLFNVFPALRRIPARLLGVGIRPEHVRTPEACSAMSFAVLAAPPQFRVGAGEDFDQTRFGLGVVFELLAERLAQMIECGFDQRRQ